MFWKVLCVVAGLLLKVLATRDLFQTLFHPAGHGALSDYLSLVVWRGMRRISRHRPKRLTLAGPFALLAIVFTWGLLLVVGNALIYWRFIPTQFVMAPGLDLSRHTSFWDAINISVGALITFGGDFETHSRWLRLLMGLEGVFGFGLLTASVSWLLSIYPVLENRRSLAHEVTLLHESERMVGVRIYELGEQELFTLLIGLTEQVAMIRNDLSQFPVTYYFQMGERITSAPGALSFLYDLSTECSRPAYPVNIRMAATMLGRAVEDYVELIAEVFLHAKTRDPQAVLRMFAEDHLRELMPETPEEWRKAG